MSIFYQYRLQCNMIAFDYFKKKTNNRSDEYKKYKWKKRSLKPFKVFWYVPNPVWFFLSFLIFFVNCIERTYLYSMPTVKYSEQYVLPPQQDIMQYPKWHSHVTKATGTVLDQSRTRHMLLFLMSHKQTTKFRNHGENSNEWYWTVAHQRCTFLENIAVIRFCQNSYLTT